MSKNNKNKHSKKVIFIIIASAFFILSIFFLEKNYKISKNGNTINKVYDNILDISSYKATAEITINSNKNSNKYIVQQTHNSNEDIQEILEPENIKGLTTTYNNGVLKIQSKKLNITKIYNEYKNIDNNDLWLNTFLEEYKISDEKLVEEKEERVIKIKNNNKYKELYMDKETGKPTKLIVKDNNQKVLIYIIYNEIEINY